MERPVVRTVVLIVSQLFGCNSITYLFKAISMGTPGCKTKSSSGIIRSYVQCFQFIKNEKKNKFSIHLPWPHYKPEPYPLHQLLSGILF